MAAREALALWTCPEMIRPIIFSGPMVRAILDGRKTQTRRLAASPLRRCEPGDLLYVRETFRHWRGSASGKTAIYSADDRWIDWGSGENFIQKVQWLSPATPSIHMPRWASRITLRIEAVRVEPLQAISEEDAKAEGLAFHNDPSDVDPKFPDGYYYIAYNPGPQCPRPTAVETYAALWRQLHGADSWDSNPDVLVLSFTSIAGNVDRIAA